MNEKIRGKIKASGVPQWRVAHELGIGETTLVRWLRFELPEEKQREILAALEKLMEEGGNE